MGALTLKHKQTGQRQSPRFVTWESAVQQVSHGGPGIRAFCKQIRNDEAVDIKQSLSTLKNQICDLQDKIQEQSYEN